MGQQDETMTVQEVAALLRVHPRTVYRLLDSGDLQGFKAGKQWRVWRSSLEKYTRNTESGKFEPLACAA